MGGSFAFNHLENGHATSRSPADPFGRGWSAAQWFAWHGQVVDGRLELPPRGMREVVPVSEPRKAV